MDPERLMLHMLKAKEENAQHIRLRTENGESYLLQGDVHLEFEEKTRVLTVTFEDGDQKFFSCYRIIDFFYF